MLNSVFLQHAVEAGLDLAMVNPAHILGVGEITAEERELAEDLIFDRREDALPRFIDALRDPQGGADGGGGRPSSPTRAGRRARST